MNRRGQVYCKGKYAGEITEADDGSFVFTYDPAYLALPLAKAVSLTLPLRKEAYTSKSLFPFFEGLLAEGVLKEIQCRALRIDENDTFGRLLITAGSETIGDVTVTEEER